MFVLFALAVVAALMALAMRINRNDNYPALSTALWVVALALLAWTGLLWFAGA